MKKQDLFSAFELTKVQSPKGIVGGRNNAPTITETDPTPTEEVPGGDCKTDDLVEDADPSSIALESALYSG